MTFKKYLQPLYDSFGQGPQPSVCIKSNTSRDLDPTIFGILCLEFDEHMGYR
jgi:hypothetical protein